MRKTTHINTGLTATAVLLIGTMAVAQSTTMARKKLPGRMKSGTIVVTKADSGNASGATTPQSTPADRKNGAVISADYNHTTADRNSAHASESLKSSDNVKKGENPLYEDHGKSGTNPLYEGREKSTANTHSYDGDPDRPMNFKQDFGQVQANKHAAGVKYNNRTAAGNNSSSSQSTPTSGSSSQQ